MRKSVQVAIPWTLFLIWSLPALRPDIFNPALLLLACLDLALDSILKSVFAAMHNAGRSGRVGLLMLGARLGRLALALMLVLLNTDNLQLFAASRLLATAGMAALALADLRPRVRMISLKQSALLIRSSWAFALSDLLATAYMQADVTLLALLGSSSRQVGLYFPALGLINALFVLPAAGYTVLLPRLTRAWGQDRTSLRRRAPAMFGLFGALGLGLTMGTLFILRPAVPLVMGESYQATGLLLGLMTPILLLKSLGFASVTLLVASDWQPKRVFTQAIAAALNLLLNLAWIPSMGIWGAVAAYLVSESALFMGYTWLAVVRVRGAARRSKAQ